MSCRPARYRTKLKPSVHHTVERASEGIAQVWSPSQFGTGMPIAPRAFSRSPSPGVKIQIQMSATTAEGRMYGAKNASRKNQRPRATRSASNASTNPRMISGGVVRIVNQIVCHNEDQKSLLDNASE